MNLRWISAWKPFLGTPQYDYASSLELQSRFKDLFSAPNTVVIAMPGDRFFAPMGMMNLKIFDPERDSFLLYPFHKQGEKKYSLKQWCDLNRTHLGERFKGKKIFFVIEEKEWVPDSCKPLTLIFTPTRKPLSGVPVAEDEWFQVYEVDGVDLKYSPTPNSVPSFNKTALFFNPLQLIKTGQFWSTLLKRIKQSQHPFIEESLYPQEITDIVTLLEQLKITEYKISPMLSKKDPLILPLIERTWPIKASQNPVVPTLLRLSSEPVTCSKPKILYTGKELTVESCSH